MGLGLIGGSLVRGMGDRAEPGWSPSATTRERARADGFDIGDDLDEVILAASGRDALIVLAAPVTAFPDLLRRIDALAPTVRLTDVAGVKAVVADQVAGLAPRARFVGGHPMAGTQYSGWSAGHADLFRDAAWVTTLTDDSDLEVWADVAGLALQVGSRVVPADADRHDAAVARISHLPHLLALALAQVGAAGGGLTLSLAASSFADGTRVAATRPELVRAICEANRTALVAAADDLLGTLGVARGSLASTGSLAKLTEAGHRARSDFERRGAELERVSLSGVDLIDQLLAVGSIGGHVSALERTPDGLRVTAHHPAQV